MLRAKEDNCDVPKNNHGSEVIDQLFNPRYHVQLLDKISSKEFVKQYKQHTYDFLQLRQGHGAIDVGSSNGDDAFNIAEVVGESGLGIGVDSGETMVSEAQEHAENSGLSAKFSMATLNELTKFNLKFIG